MLLQRDVVPSIATGTAIVDAINSVYDRSVNEAEQVVDEMEALDLDKAEAEIETKDLIESDDDEAPIIRLVNSLLYRAAKERASDIHIEPMERELSVRFRVDGVLQEIIKPPKRYQNSILSRVKIMAQLNIAEKRPAAGRPHSHQAGGPRHRHSRLDGAGLVRRAHRAASARQELDGARPEGHRDGRRHPQGHRRHHSPLARHHSRHGPDRLGVKTTTPRTASSLHRAGRARDENDAVRAVNDVVDVLEDVVAHPDVLQVEHRRALVEQTQHDALAVRDRHRRDANVDVAAASLMRMRPSCGRRFSAMLSCAMIFTRLSRSSSGTAWAA